MNVVVKGGIVIGVIVLVLTQAWGFAGLYRNTSLDWVLPVVFILVELGVLIWVLRQTAPFKGYGGQVGTGTKVALVAGVIVIASTLLFISLFPDYKEIALAGAADDMRDKGLSEQQIQQQLPLFEAILGPVGYPIYTFVMTVLTGVVCSLIIAAFVRRKEVVAQPA